VCKFSRRQHGADISHQSKFRFSAILFERVRERHTDHNGGGGIQDDADRRHSAVI
jgi:hypothetical protein